jgi:DNA-binding MarR family transcriptional regulator/N-acetylglutamate synthase-like GNAT family acetyltransferase
MSDVLPQIRSFHRTVTQRIGALNDRYLGRDRPLAESRLLFEIGTEGAAVRDLRVRLGLDAGFISRMLRSLESAGLVRTRRVEGEDGRARFATLTRAGRAELRKLDELSDELARSILTPLKPEQGEKLVAAMAEVERLLRASAISLEVVDPKAPEAAWCLTQYFQELNVRFRKGFDPKVTLPTPAEDFAAPKGAFVIARLFGQPVGCGALRQTGRDVVDVKRMWVAPRARGMGVGRRILGELERIARSRRFRAIRLDTNESLKEAQALYRSSGFVEVDAFNDEPYAQHWFEKRLRPPSEK